MHPAIAHTVELSLVYISWLINCTISFFVHKQLGGVVIQIKIN